MNADLLYAILMTVGWAFLVGWLALLAIACGLAFRSESPVQTGQTRFANGYHPDVSTKISWKVHLRN